jgi:hypothetical protein
MTEVSRPGGRENPIPANAPAREIGEYLRTLRRCAGRPSYRRMSKLVGCAEQNTLSRAANGLTFPDWKVVVAYVTGVMHCAQQDNIDVQHRMRRHAAQFVVGPDLSLMDQAKAVYDWVCAQQPTRRGSRWTFGTPAPLNGHADASATPATGTGARTAADTAARPGAPVPSQIGSQQDESPLGPLPERPPLSAADVDPDSGANGTLPVASEEESDSHLRPPTRRHRRWAASIRRRPPTAAAAGPTPTAPPTAPPSGWPVRNTIAVIVIVAVGIAAVIAAVTGSGVAARVRTFAGEGTGREITPVDPGPLASPLLPADTGGSADTEFANLPATVRHSAPPLPQGRYAYVHLRTSTYGSSSVDAAGHPTTSEQRTWWPAQGKGTQITVNTPPSGIPEPPQEDPWTPADLGKDLQTPLSQDPAEVTDQFTRRHPYVVRAIGRVRATVDFNRYQVLDPGQRAAILEVLAATPGIVILDGRIFDSEKRPGIAVKACADDGTCETLTFDPKTGVLLSHQTAVVSTAQRPGPDRVTAYTVFLDLTRTDEIGM